MTRKVLAGLALAGALSGGIAPEPAAADHIQSPLAGFTCAYIREGQTAGHAIISAHITQMGPGWVKVECESTNLVLWCFFYGYNNSTLGISGPFNQTCGPI